MFIKKLIKGIKNPQLITLYILNFKIFRIIPDRLYLNIKYKLKIGKKLDAVDPKTFNEKLQWLKLFDRKPEYTQMVDKYEVRKYIKDTIGEEYLVPLIGVYDRFGDIDFDSLPDQFVLKPNHTSGNVVVCKDKSKLDFLKLEKEINRWLKQRYYWVHREWPYKNVKPKIICEEMMDSKIMDYKFFCFDGKPMFLYVSQGLVCDHSLKVDFYDLDWNRMPFKRTDYDNFDKILEKPQNFDLMIRLAVRLSEGFPFIRIDLYNIGNRVYFSEFTFSPCSGLMPIEPIEYDELLGNLIQLPIS